MQPHRDQHRAGAAHELLPAVGLVVLFLAAAMPLIVSGVLLGRPGGDAVNYHEPVIRTFARQWPRVDFTDYVVTTTPGYHLALAAVCRYASDSRLVLQLVGSLFTVGLLWTFGRGLMRFSRPAPLAEGGAGGGFSVLEDGSREAGRSEEGRPDAERRGTQERKTDAERRSTRVLAIALPFAASMHVFFSGVWLLPDNAAWWGVLGVLLLAWNHRPGRRWLILAAGVMAALVLARQVHLWAAAVIWTAAWVGGRLDDSKPPGDDDGRPADRGPPSHSVGWIFTDIPRRARAAALALLATLPAFVIVGCFVWVWGGLTPPTWQPPRFPYDGLGLSAAALLLALIGFFGVAYAGYWLPGAARLARERPGTLAAAALIAGVVAIVPATTASTPERDTGLWKLAAHAPVIAGHTSVVVLGLNLLGGVTAAGFLALLPSRERWLSVATLAGFAAAQTASPLVYQRYTEPMALMLLALWAARALAAVRAVPTAAPGVPNGGGPMARALNAARLLGPLALGVACAGLTAYTMATSSPPDRTEVLPHSWRHPWWYPNSPPPAPPTRR